MTKWFPTEIETRISVNHLLISHDKLHNYGKDYYFYFLINEESNLIVSSDIRMHPSKSKWSMKTNTKCSRGYLSHSLKPYSFLEEYLTTIRRTYKITICRRKTTYVFWTFLTNYFHPFRYHSPSLRFGKRFTNQEHLKLFISKLSNLTRLKKKSFSHLSLVFIKKNMYFHCEIAFYYSSNTLFVISQSHIDTIIHNSIELLYHS